MTLHDLRHIAGLALPSDTPVVLIDALGCVRRLFPVAVERSHLNPAQVDLPAIPDPAIILLDLKDRLALRQSPPDHLRPL